MVQKCAIPKLHQIRLHPDIIFGNITNSGAFIAFSELEYKPTSIELDMKKREDGAIKNRSSLIAITVHCKLDNLGHQSDVLPGNGTGLAL